MKCLNCDKPAEYFVRNSSTKEQLFCRAHIPSFLNFAKELQKRIFPVAVEAVSAPVVEAPVEEKPAKKKKKEEAPVEAEAPVVVEEVKPVEEPEVVAEEIL